MTTPGTSPSTPSHATTTLPGDLAVLGSRVIETLASYLRNVGTGTADPRLVARLLDNLAVIGDLEGTSPPATPDEIVPYLEAVATALKKQRR